MKCRRVNKETVLYMLRCNAAQLRHYVKAGILHPIETGLKASFDLDEIEAFISKREKLLTGF
jgi:hypothetical protein